MTALELTARGVARFFYEPSPEHPVETQPRFRAKTAELREEILAEIARRAGEISAQIPDAGPVPLIRITEAPSVRHGKCDCCGDPMESHRGGMCPLCVRALRLALKSKGRL